MVDRGAVTTAAEPAELLPHGLPRVRELWRRWRREKEDPEPFYSMLALETVARLERRHGLVAGTRVLDLGCGPGFYTTAFRRRGADVVPLDGSFDELDLAGDPPAGAVLGDAGHTPFPPGTFAAIFCSNLLEHARDTAAIVDEFARLLRPGGWGYLSWTNWYSPWGGHDMTPYQFLGPERGPRLYERRHGPPRKNRYGEGLFAVHIGPTLRLVQAHSDLSIERSEPRYWSWAPALTKIPGLRELVCWNCVLHLRRR